MDNELKFILNPADLKLYACRGEGKGCKRNKFREAKKPCESCVPCDDPDETLGELQARLAKGDA